MTPWQEGYEAYKNYYNLEDNPYVHVSESSYWQWKDGWLAAQLEDDND